MRPHRRQPTRLPRPWDSPGKNTGVGCRFLLQPMKVKNESEVAQWCPTHRYPMDCSLPASSVHGIFQARVVEWGAIVFSTPQPTPGISLKSAGVKLSLMRVFSRSLVTIPPPFSHCKVSASWTWEGTLAYGKAKGLILHGDFICWDTAEPSLWTAGPSLLPALLQPSRPLVTCWDGKGEGLWAAS